MFFRFIFIFILTVFFAKASATEDINLKIFRFVYNQNYDSAHYYLNCHASELDQFYQLVLRTDLSYWENVTGTDSPDYKTFDNELEKIMPDNMNSFENKINTLVALSYRLRFEFKRSHYISALKTRKKTISLFNELKDAGFSSSTHKNEIFRLYNSLILYFNQFPSKYFSRTSRVNMEKAIKQMEELSQSNSPIVKTLSAYFLGKIFLEYEKKSKNGIPYFTYLSEEYPKNEKFGAYLEECLDKIP